MTFDWSPLKHELARWRQDGLALPLWWRDDDAIEDTAALRKLLKTSADLHLPVHLAIIPALARPSLVSCCEASDGVIPLVHGWRHHNNAPAGQKKAEFGHPRVDALPQSAAALTRLRDMFGAQLLEMFVPPWNRIDVSVTHGLAAQGYRMLSTYRPRSAPQVAGLAQINTHIDPIFWRGGGGVADPEALIAGLVKTLQDRRSGVTDRAEPLGFLSHHLVHDEAIWDFTHHCLSVLLEGGATPINLSKRETS